MKKVYHILFIFTTVCLWSSCANLDLDPLDTGSRDSWYSSEDEIQRSIGGLYRTVFFTLNGNESTIDYSPWSDDNQSRASLNFITGGTINGESDQVKKRWQNGYKAIARANILLEKLEDANSVGISEEKKQLYRAQTLFVRATQYAILTSLFGDVVYIDKVTTKKWNTEECSNRIDLQRFHLSCRFSPTPPQSLQKPNQDVATLLVRNHTI